MVIQATEDSLLSEKLVQDAKLRGKKRKIISFLRINNREEPFQTKVGRYGANMRLLRDQSAVQEEVKDD